MKAQLSFQIPKSVYVLFTLFLLLSMPISAQTTQSLGILKWGSIDGFEFTNGHESVSIQDGASYSYDDLPGHFYVNARVKGYAQSVKFDVENLDSGRQYSIIENLPPYTFPAGNGDWNIGKGNFKITATLYKKDNAQGECDLKTIMFTLGDLDCTADAGTITADMDSVTIANGEAMLSATPDGNIVVPPYYSSIYVLTSGEGLVIEQVNVEAASFTVKETGLYTIHTLVYDGREDSANYLDLSIVKPGVTTGVDVLNAIAAAGICASLDAAGAPIKVEEGSDECLADSGTMYSKNPINCLSGGTATISAKINESPTIPSGYNQLFVLTDAFSLTILNVSGTPEFEVDHAGFYRIHSLVYNPDTLDLSVVVPGQTTGFDVAGLIADNGICASLDVQGAVNLVIGSKWFCYFFNKYFKRSNDTGKGSTSKGSNDGANLEDMVSNFNSYEDFKNSFISDNAVTKFYPNPVVNTLNIEMDVMDNEIMNYSVMDVSGRLVLSGVARNLENGRDSIDLSRLTSGMYLVQFASEFRTITKKIMIRN